MLRLFKKEGRKEKNKLYNVSRKLNLCLLGFLFVLFDFPQKFNDPSQLIYLLFILLNKSGICWLIIDMTNFKVAWLTWCLSTIKEQLKKIIVDMLTT